MKTPTLWMVQVLCLIGFFAGPLQTSQTEGLQTIVAYSSLQDFDRALNVINMPLNMSEKSVDDQYINCKPPKVLPPESSRYIPVPTNYKTTWQKAKRHWAEVGKSITDLTPMQGTAIVAYTLADNLYRDFNAATRVAGSSQNTYNQFAFKDFFFLLTKGVQARKKKNNKCYDVFRGVQGIRFNVRNGQQVRFGQFTSSSLSEQVARGFGQDTFFSIKTCHGVPIDDISSFKGEKEVLIPPYEKFVVKSKVNVSPIRLESKGVYSRFNCERLRGKRLGERRT
ncbi:NAD(P)(+)--arginine ADP-ribosyltransferase 2-like [Protobothrops mucrosquamatus]|uniref:NAD(P)(+)--arginine ADP-ribosyltransferase 2-like n=1 Tax=Protobothrops mucrosquamatus TaxID=103944 RepID=UPI0010FADFEC|nr:NAD(P)(+)--arginine ADP-ribosyltransferase 2-like [Protobothrops mucrosquamatus]